MDINDFWLSVKSVFINIWEFVQIPLFKVSDTSISTGTIVYVIFALLLLSFFSKRFRKLLINRILKRAGMGPEASLPIANISRFFIMVVGTLVIVQSTGINLSALTVLFGALGVGIGFGLQTITDNFISGIIILFEKPIKVGDRIDVGGVSGNVTVISIRATTVITNDNVSIIVPNSEFISSQVINWSHNDRRVRFKFAVGVSYKEDPQFIRKILLEVANANSNVLKNPGPDVLFDEFGDNSLNFKLMVWTETMVDSPSPFKSELYYAIFEKFREHKIEIPFPQRDLHLRSSEVEFVKK